ncbi:hypothetical protein VP01_2063g4 [Puccinia sorghi]|uniref:Uncharacterized protein n=1 Tax=Puccinia sorghi TaxID=27349 RepID=A0A0L6VAK4_9BASI|nr:hypothetical protein VP01_2063g4 [Puccinia sorghi]
MACVKLASVSLCIQMRSSHTFKNQQISMCHTFCIMALSLLKREPRNMSDCYQNDNQHSPVIPSNPQTLISKANLDVELTKKICCQVCFCLYEFQPTTPWRAITNPLATQIPVTTNSLSARRSIKVIKIV